MEEETKYCPDHPDMKVPPFKDECMICNKPLQLHGRPIKPIHGRPIDPPVPIVDEEPGKTVYVHRMDTQDSPEEEKAIRDRLPVKDKVDAPTNPETTIQSRPPDATVNPLDPAPDVKFKPNVEHDRKAAGALKATIKEKIDAKLEKRHAKGHK